MQYPWEGNIYAPRWVRLLYIFGFPQGPFAQMLLSSPSLKSGTLSLSVAVGDAAFWSGDAQPSPVSLSLRLHKTRVHTMPLSWTSVISVAIRSLNNILTIFVCFLGEGAEPFPQASPEARAWACDKAPRGGGSSTGAKWGNGSWGIHFPERTGSGLGGSTAKCWLVPGWSLGVAPGYVTFDPSREPMSQLISFTNPGCLN